jgi:acetolactate synthase-1/2/3 large subunit
MIRIADYIAVTLAEHGIRHVFMVTGGGAMHLNDAIGRHRDLSVVCCHHEQTCAMAAESYFRITNRLAAVNVTSGPGGTNAVTGVYGAHVDSMGMIVVSGQVKRETLVRSTGLPLRQLGDQEVDIISMVKGVTKYAVQLWEPESIRYHLEKALHLATTGRPGPVWIDVPIDLQATRIDPTQLRGYDPVEDELQFQTTDLEAAADHILARVSASERPVIYPGTGIRLSGLYDTFVELVETLGIPVVPAWNSNDLLPYDHPQFAGRPGTLGDRPGNFAAQNADFLLILGCRLNIRLVSYNWGSFGRGAYKAMVDIDAAELRKPTLDLDYPVHADLRQFLPLLLERARAAKRRDQHANWLSWCKERLARYPVVLPEYWTAART